MTATTRQYLTFQVGNQWYGLAVDDVVEVLHMMMLTDVPLTTPDVLGLMTVRDLVVTVIDLRIRFGVPDPQYRLDTPIIVARTPKGAVGLVVDMADNVEQVSDAQLISHDGATFPYVNGIAKLSDLLLLLLDTASLLTNQEATNALAIPDAPSST